MPRESWFVKKFCSYIADLIEVTCSFLSQCLSCNLCPHLLPVCLFYTYLSWQTFPIDSGPLCCTKMKSSKILFVVVVWILATHIPITMLLRHHVSLVQKTTAVSPSRDAAGSQEKKRQHAIFLPVY